MARETVAPALKHVEANTRAVSARRLSLTLRTYSSDKPKESVEAMLSDGKLVDLLEKAESRVERYWGFYALVALGAAAWLLSGPGLPNEAVPWVVAAPAAEAKHGDTYG
jgi:hypothetical protein